MTAELLAMGRARYDVFCAVCHGVLGDGDSLVATNMELVKPPSLHGLDFPPGHYYRVITEGFGLMPSYAAELGIRERWAVVAYVEALRMSQRFPLAELPPELAAEAEEALR